MSQAEKKVVWYEGMTLDPHHFQQWDRYVHHTVQSASRNARPYNWGFVRLDIDEERLSNGEFALRACSGLLPDGLAFDIPNSDPLPPPRNIQEAFPATEESLAVYLAIPARKSDGGNTQLQSSNNRREPRFLAETVQVPDDNTGVDERSVEVAHGNFQVRLEGEPMQTFSTMQVARVVRGAGGGFRIADGFIAPSLRINASGNLESMARRLLELLVTRSSSLSERREALRRQRDLSPSDMTVLGLLGAVNTYLPLVKHHHDGGRSHPEELFKVMLALAGQLTVYAREVRTMPRDFPAYDHSNLTSCFNRLDQLLREMLGEAEPPSNYDQIPLQSDRENLYTASLSNAQLDGSGLFLVVKDDQIEKQRLVSELPLMLRVASPSTIDAVLRSYTRALPIEHAASVPTAIPLDEEACYIRLKQQGPFWDAITDDSALSVYVPPDFKSVRLQLVATKSSA